MPTTKHQCTHPDHTDEVTCEERAVACSPHCECCLGVSAKLDVTRAKEETDKFSTFLGISSNKKQRPAGRKPWAKYPPHDDENEPKECVHCGGTMSLRDGREWDDRPDFNVCDDCAREVIDMLDKELEEFRDALEDLIGTFPPLANQVPALSAARNLMSLYRVKRQLNAQS